jgi:hypothetical protein
MSTFSLEAVISSPRVTCLIAAQGFDATLFSTVKLTHRRNDNRRKLC